MCVIDYKDHNEVFPYIIVIVKGLGLGVIVEDWNDTFLAATMSKRGPMRSFYKLIKWQG